MQNTSLKSLFPGEPVVASCPLIFFLHFFQKKRIWWQLLLLLVGKGTVCLLSE